MRPTHNFSTNTLRNVGQRLTHTAPVGSLGVSELLVIAAIILIVFGGKRLPDAAKGLGAAIRNFKDAAKDEKRP